MPVELGREVAALIPGARFIEYPGEDTYGWLDDSGLDDVEEFLTGRRGAETEARAGHGPVHRHRGLHGPRLARLGDGRWGAAHEHNTLVRDRLAHWRGNEVKTIGDGFLATFDGPARAVRCAAEIVEGAESSLGLSVRTGLHTGECELVGNDVAGIAVHIGARVMSTADGGEVLASSTVRDLVVGSGLRFTPTAVRMRSGRARQWHLYALEPDD